MIHIEFVLIFEAISVRFSLTIFYIDKLFHLYKIQLKYDIVKWIFL